MSWIARVLTITEAGSELRSQIEVGFYDDSDPRNSPLPVVFLHKVLYSSETIDDVTDLIATVQEDGKKARSDYEHVNALAQALPLGAQLAIDP